MITLYRNKNICIRIHVGTWYGVFRVTLYIYIYTSTTIKLYHNRNVFIRYRCCDMVFLSSWHVTTSLSVPSRFFCFISALHIGIPIDGKGLLDNVIDNKII